MVGPIPIKVDVTDEEENNESYETALSVAPSGPQIVQPMRSKWVYVVIILVASSLLAIIGILMYDRRQLQSKVSEQSQTQPVMSEADDLNSAVRGLIELPTIETPTVGTVADIEKLKQQSPGFEYAKTGDKLLIYTNAQRIVVYRPESNKIVSIVQISLGQKTDDLFQKKQ